MKKIILTISLILLTCLPIFGQKLTLTDLTNLCNKKNWEEVNQTLLAKGWVFYDSEKGSTYKYNAITWSFNKEYYNDKAQGWFYLYTFEGLPNKISYTVLNKESYSLIQNSISSAGFKLVNSEIEDNQVISTYSNASYTLKISTEKRKDDDWSSSSLTAYKITLIKKASIYDADNGKKTDYYYDEVVKAEYTLLNGKLNGQGKTYHLNGKIHLTGNYTNGEKNGLFKEYDDNGNLETEYSMLNGELNGEMKTYYSNGKLKKSGNYLKGEEHGNFVEYDEYGNKLAEYVMLNGKKNGVFKFYEKNGKINVSTTFKDDINNGQEISYFYDDETGELHLKQIGEYLNGERNGTWSLLMFKDGKERLLTFENYKSGLLNGPFQNLEGDSLIIGSYNNDKLNGEYQVYLDINRLHGGEIQTDTTKLILLSEGGYSNGLKTGYWKKYDFTGSLINEGRFSIGQKSGEWKYYYPKWTDEKGEIEPYSKHLFLIQNYSNGKLDGKSTRYSRLNEEEYPCSETDVNKNPIDTCTRYVYQKILEISFYKNGKLNGPFEIRDSLNEVYAKGSFKDDLKDGEWFYRYSDKDFEEKTYFIYRN